MEYRTTESPQEVQAYVESMMEDFENDNPGVAEALRLHDEAMGHYLDAMNHYLPAALALAPRVVRKTAAHSSGFPPLTGIKKRGGGFAEGDTEGVFYVNFGCSELPG